MKYTFLAFISISSLFSQIDYGFGFSKGGLAGFQFLKIETGAVSQAFSGAYSASSKDSKSFSNNISRISKISDISIFPYQAKIGLQVLKSIQPLLPLGKKI